MMNRKRSKYDEFFHAIDDKAVCKVCERVLPWSSSSGTGSLRHHLQAKHYELFVGLEREFAAKQQKLLDLPMLVNASTPSTSFFPPLFCASNQPENHPKLTKWDTIIIKTIARDLMPFSTIDNKGFASLIKNAAPGDYQMPDRQFFIKTGLPSLAGELEEKIREDLGTMESVTLNCASLAVGEKLLASVTAHWTNRDTFEPKSCVIGARISNSRNQSVVYKNLIDESIRRLGIEEGRIRCYVKKEQELNLALMNAPTLHCFIQAIQWAVNKVLESDTSLMTMTVKMKLIGAKLAKSEIHRVILPIEDVETKAFVEGKPVSWKVLDAMIDSFLKNKQIISELMPNNPALDENDWLMMNTLHCLIQPFVELTEPIKNRTVVPASVIVPTLTVTMHKMDSMHNFALSSDMEKRFCEVLKAHILEWWQACQHRDFLNTCTFVDPRFKNSFFTEDYTPEILNLLKKRAGHVLKDEPVEDSKEGLKTMSSFDLYLKMTKNQSSFRPLDECNDIEKEVMLYLQSPPDSSIDPFSYWQSHTEFPELRKLAMELMSVPAVSSEVQHLLPISEMIERRSNDKMVDQELERLIFCNLNLIVYGMD